jgi:hypothetical protein
VVKVSLMSKDLRILHLGKINNEIASIAMEIFLHWARVREVRNGAWALQTLLP